MCSKRSNRTTTSFDEEFKEKLDASFDTDDFEVTSNTGHTSDRCQNQT